MTESFITILLLGLFAGFFFSVPIAGPISILITSNALKGRLRYCLRTALGGAIIETIYVFISVYGITSLYNYYQNAIPVILIVGSLFLLFVAYKVFKSKVYLEDISRSETNNIEDNKGGFRTGLILNFSNPSLFLGWFTSSFLLISFASSIGFNTGGMDILLYENVSSIEEITGESIEPFDEFDLMIEKTDEQPARESLSTFVLSLTYALMVGLGSFIWFYLLSKLLISFREKININWLNGLVKTLGVFLFGIGFYLIYTGMNMLL